ncbi:MAG TPA: sulfite exporter TauE/SafE family protein [Ktedonobacteraceae bacterium]|nr:sulfite exporter TauE/SafE family protein [Ktedonobacteraceae bacterium]
MDFRYSLVGLLIGVLVGLTGMGGGSLLAPILILVFGVPPVWAVGTDVAYSTVTKALGSVVHIRQKQVNFKIALWLACGSVPATLLSVTLVQYIRRHYGSVVNGVILHAIGFTLILVAVLLVAKPFLMRRVEQKRLEAQKQAALAGEAGELTSTSNTNRWEKRYRPLVTILIGAFVGFLVGLTSVGSGTLIIVSLAFLFPRLTAKELVGTDIFQAFMLLAAGAIAYITAGTINWHIAGLLLIGSLPGVFVGSKLSKFIPEPYMRPVLAVVLVISGWKLI